MSVIFRIACVVLAVLLEHEERSYIEYVELSLSIYIRGCV